MIRYIITKHASMFIHHKWSLQDSYDDVLYETFELAAAQHKKIGGAGVAEVYIKSK